MTSLDDLRANNWQLVEAVTAAELETVLRAIGAERYHNNHPFHERMREGALSKGAMQAWALNRYLYQSRIPMKDAALMARMVDTDLRREWRHRIEDHDGIEGDDGGIERWLKLAEGLGLDRAYVISEQGALPATHFAVEAYIRYVADQSLLAAIASSLTELFAPTIIADRVSSVLANYDYVSKDSLAYFDRRMTQAPRDSGFALQYCKDHAIERRDQQEVIDALLFKTGMLWAMLDALDYCYVSDHGAPPPGCFVPECG